jgi:hypothetical protein
VRHGRAASDAGEAEPAVIDLTSTPEAPSPARHPVGAAAAGHAEPVDSSPDAVLRRCERISADLRSKLGTQEGARCGAATPNPALPHAPRMLACWAQRRTNLAYVLGSITKKPAPPWPAPQQPPVPEYHGDA